MLLVVLANEWESTTWAAGVDLQNMQGEGQGQVEAPLLLREIESDAAATCTAHPLAQMCKCSSVSSFV